MIVFYGHLCWLRFDTHIFFGQTQTLLTHQCLFLDEKQYFYTFVSISVFFCDPVLLCSLQSWPRCRSESSLRDGGVVWAGSWTLWRGILSSLRMNLWRHFSLSTARFVWFSTLSQTRLLRQLLTSDISDSVCALQRVHHLTVIHTLSHILDLKWNNDFSTKVQNFNFNFKFI